MTLGNRYVRLAMICAVLTSAPAGAAAQYGAGFSADGNPFWRQGRPRATLLGGDVAVRPTAMPSPAALPTPIVPQAELSAVPPPSDVAAATPATINPSNHVLPNVGVVPQDVPPQVAALPAPVEPAGPAFAPPSAMPQAVAAAPELHGLDILRQRPTDGAAHPLAAVMAWVDDALLQSQGLRDYTCTFKKREAIGGRLNEQQSMFVKSRLQPLSVYMYFLDQDVRGQEAIYVEGRNNGHIVAHPVGFKQTLVGTLSLAPTDPQAMEGNRYPITNFGIVNLMRRYRQGVERDLHHGEVELKVIEGARVNDRTCTCIQVTHPVQRGEYPYAMTRLYVDDELNLPIRYEGYEWPRRQGDAPPLAEEYTYSNLKLNVGLSDADFDPRNPQYGYK